MKRKAAEQQKVVKTKQAKWQKKIKEQKAYKSNVMGNRFDIEASQYPKSSKQSQ